MFHSLDPIGSKVWLPWRHGLLLGYRLATQQDASGTWLPWVCGGKFQGVVGLWLPYILLRTGRIFCHGTCGLWVGSIFFWSFQIFEGDSLMLMQFESMPWHVVCQWDWWVKGALTETIMGKYRKFLVIFYCNWVLPNSFCASKSVRAPKGWCCTTTSCLTSRPPTMAVWRFCSSQKISIGKDRCTWRTLGFLCRFRCAICSLQVSSVRCVPMTHAIRVWWKWIVKVQAKTWWTAQQSAWYQKWAHGCQWVLALIRS